MLNALTVLIVLSGCGIYRVPPQSANYYYLNPDKNLRSVGRVALVELTNESTYPQISADVTESLFQAVQKRQLFGLSIVRQTDASWQSLQLNTDSAYTLEQLAAVRRTLECDAVLFGTVTNYQPYPRMSIGLRLMLIDLRDGQLLWALEQVWDSSDKATENQIKDYFANQLRRGFAPLREQLMTISPLEFVKFVAYKAAETLR